ncbi:MAG: carboxylating nicotinate-nucleotide diphosphorylase [Candidatus Calescibacterium sp.]|nr:carboxylating nicotinate-nucleotide diphosphorylase [Candidatus Calescibacterium sp.]MDW8087245.1 carboxylating nicotinate-nucleotide diphosphorylase [Candidatus Calescibacterium sp.]
MGKSINFLALDELNRSIERWLKEDEIFSDVTTSFLGIGGRGKIIFFSKNHEDFVVAGLDFVVRIFNYVASKKHTRFRFSRLKKDGDLVKNGEKILEISGEIRLLFALERVSLNILSRLSGIATETKKMADVCSRYGVEFCATRKTTPGLRYLEKYAVVVGGGSPHRLNLSEAILVKDNHIQAVGGIRSVLKIISENRSKFERLKKEFEIEVQSEQDLEFALQISLILKKITIMLDNIPLEILPQMIQKIRDFSGKNLVEIKIEISGGVRPNNVELYAKLKPDRISSGYITLAPSIPDISADIKKL